MFGRGNGWSYDDSFHRVTIAGPKLQQESLGLRCAGPDVGQSPDHALCAIREDLRQPGAEERESGLLEDGLEDEQEVGRGARGGEGGSERGAIEGELADVALKLHDAGP